MAAIDKCYVDSWEDYQEFKNWANGKSYTTPRGCKINVSDYLIAWDDKNYFEEDGKPCERPIFNSPTHFDNYLYHNCPIQFIKDWLNDRYSGEGYCKGLPDEITRNPKLPEYTPCTKVKVLKKGFGKCPDISWWVYVDVNDPNSEYPKSCWYNEDKDFWILPDEDDVWTSNVGYFKCNVRTIIRKILKKWKLPVGCTVEVRGRCMGDKWILKTK